MKNISKIASLLLAGLMVWSCAEQDNMDPVGNWDLTTPVLTTPSDNATVTLNENTPSATTRFEWQAATASNRFGVAYTFALVPEGSTDYNNPILSLTPGNAGRELFVTPTAAQIDYALWAACYDAGESATLDWVVIAKAIEKTTVSTQKVTIKRFDTEYMPSTLFLSGTATEVGNDVAQAVAMRARKDADGNNTNIFDVYTRLTEGSTYHFHDQPNGMARKIGGADGTLSCGTEITAPATGVYRVTVNLNDNTYALWNVDRWSLVGDAVEGGWGGDVPLDYIGDGVWQKKIEFYQPYEGAGFIFRANGDWGYIIKRIEGTATPDNKGGEVLMESEAGDAGVSVQDPAGTEGLHLVTLDLSADGYTYTLVPEAVTGPVATIIGKTNNPNADAVTGNFAFGTYDLPSELYLLSDGQVVAQLTKDGDIFRSEKYLALQASKTYTLNSAADGSGTTYNEHGNGTISVDHDQAYQVNVDFAQGKVFWKHYNLKLFHWDEVGGGWDQRQELVMTYIHPYNYEVSGSLFAGYHSKFISPWDVQFGTSATALSGTMTNGGANFTGINSNGTYDATITVSDDYTTADYAFVKQ